jgi:DNA-binding transcriptional MerR regulator
MAPPPATAYQRDQSANDDGRSRLMTVGQLARRTGLSHKAIRELEGRGLIYSAGRSEANYRLFDETALWCAEAIGEMRSLGLTLAEIERLHASYLEHPHRPGRPATRAPPRPLPPAHRRPHPSATANAQENFQAHNRELLAATSHEDPAGEDPCPARQPAAETAGGG